MDHCTHMHGCICLSGPIASCTSKKAFTQYCIYLSEVSLSIAYLSEVLRSITYFSEVLRSIAYLSEV